MANQKKNPTHPRKGLAVAALVIPVGIAAWVFLWQYGFIASVVAWGIAAGAVWLYKKASQGEVTRAVAPYLLGLILLGVILAFLGGMVSDAWAAYRELGGTEGFFSGEFSTFVTDNMASAELWQSYTVDILISLAFAVLGAGGIILDLFKGKSPVKNKDA